MKENTATFDLSHERHFFSDRLFRLYYPQNKLRKTLVTWLTFLLHSSDGPTLALNTWQKVSAKGLSAPFNPF